MRGWVAKVALAPVVTDPDGDGRDGLGFAARLTQPGGDSTRLSVLRDIRAAPWPRI